MASHTSVTPDTLLDLRQALVSLQSAMVESTSNGDRAPLRVLVADSSVDVADLLSLLFLSNGHECHIAYTGSAALGLTAAFAPDLVLLDMNLPDITGYDVARELRRRSGSNVPYLAAVTGSGQAINRARAIAAGFDHHVVKPMKQAALDEIVRAVELRIAARVRVG